MSRQLKMRFAPVASAPGAHHILRVQAGGGEEISLESIKSLTKLYLRILVSSAILIQVCHSKILGWAP